jgi:hypothetical protein
MLKSSSTSFVSPSWSSSPTSTDESSWYRPKRPAHSPRCSCSIHISPCVSFHGYRTCILRQSDRWSVRLRSPRYHHQQQTCVHLRSSGFWCCHEGWTSEFFRCRSTGSVRVRYWVRGYPGDLAGNSWCSDARQSGILCCCV